MQRSLSVLMPVRDVQSTLATSVQDLLDVVADSSDRFELLIIDDGSTDATAEVAHELTRHYPQIRVVHHRMSLGNEIAIRTGLNRSQGDVVVMCEDNGGFRILKHGDSRQRVASRPARPNYLARLRGLVKSAE